MSAAEMFNQTSQMINNQVQLTQELMNNCQKVSTQSMERWTKQCQAVAAQPFNPQNMQKNQEVAQQIFQDVVETTSNNTQRCFDYMQECMKAVASQFNQVAENAKGKK